MFPGLGGGMDPKKMKGMMNKLGIKTEDINATEVIIRGDKEIVIKNPQVTVVDFQGQKSFQIVGTVVEKGRDVSEDVKLVVEKTGVSEKKAKEALERNNGDIAKTILDLS